MNSIVAARELGTIIIIIIIILAVFRIVTMGFVISSSWSLKTHNPEIWETLASLSIKYGVRVSYVVIHTYLPTYIFILSSG